ncbi:uncharacterized protein SPPG_01993 [Spizellomyces punctatus DAOM BR117]|uniref:TOG domain-containing protein n=1 Tax=Spizellomyces punctatus (strain DAOM BR117) TaxID=645134 RepID=A0A0L0HPC7_SPIPD|nr:uncharacterized protein SPPG_01993 [Spizellomyces punctatus DAOM BR117]KND02913.1 hypothetical protein SPPG_01993 [Spizellomyces punctatus DAOM BR117]|eukprot:XP_016610952.1 hypothetical protein SPPG_01993 [Spizellomyces punctatus DAOM BR117]
METVRAFVEAMEGTNIDRKLQTLEELLQEFSTISVASIEPDLYENFLDAVVRCIKSPQLKLCQQALSFLPVLSVSTDARSHNSASHLRTIVVFAAPVVVERLADGKEKIRELAQAAIIELYRIVCRSVAHSASKDSNKEGGPYAQMLIFLDREMKTNGFGHKTPRGREQAVIWLVQCVRAVPEFPVKQYIPLLVRLLEDSNESVRNTSKEAVIAVYNNTTIKAMRTDIKKELVKNKIRQSIVDHILANFIDGQAESPADTVPDRSESTLSGTTSAALGNGAPRRETGAVSPPNNLAGGTSAPDPDPINIGSSKELEMEISAICVLFEGKETEENWKAREDALQRLRGICRGTARHIDGFINYIRPATEPITRTMHSLRTALVMTTCTTVVDMVNILGCQLDPLVDAFIVNLLKLSGQAKKVVATASISAIQILLQRTSYQLKFVQYFQMALSDKSAGTRSAAALFIKTVVEVMGSSDTGRSTLETSGGLDIVEKGLKKGLADANGPVRQTCRETFSNFQSAWPERAEILFDTLDAATRKAISRAKLSSAPAKIRPSIRAVAATRSAFSNPANDSPALSEGTVEGINFAIEPQESDPLPNGLSLEDGIHSVGELRAATPKTEDPQDNRGIILQQLMHENVDEQVRGYCALATLARQHSERGISLEMEPEFNLAIRSAIGHLLEKGSEDISSTLLDAEYLAPLIDSRIIAISELLIPILASAGSGNPGRQSAGRGALEFVKGRLGFVALLDMVVRFLTKPSEADPCPGGAQTQRLARWGAAEWIESTNIGTEPIHGEVAAYFADPSNCQLLFHGLVNQISHPGGDDRRLLRLLRLVQQSRPDQFAHLLSTCDDEITERIQEELGVKRTLLTSKDRISRGPPALLGVHDQFGDGEPSEGITVEDLSRIEAGEGATLLDMTDMTFDTSLMLQGHVRNLMDETMPYGMADMSSAQASFAVHRAGETALVWAVQQSQQGGGSEACEQMDIAVPQSADSSPRESAKRKGSEGPSAGLVGIKRERRSSTETTPLKPGATHMGTKFDVFSAGTPTPMQLSKIDRAREIPTLLDAISKGTAEDTVWRRLYRICDGSAAPGDDFDEEEYWNQWFAETLAVLLSFLRRGGQNKMEQETCLLLLTRMIERLSQYFIGHEAELLMVLLQARSDGTELVSGSATNALSIMAEKLDGRACLDALLKMLYEWDMARERQRKMLSVSSRLYSGRSKTLTVESLPSYEPTPAESGLEILGTFLSKVDGADVEEDALWRIGDIGAMYMSCQVTETRRLATLCLVDVYSIVGDRVWQYLGKLSKQQRKLLQVIIDRQLHRKPSIS